MAAENNNIDVSRFNDSVALTTSWEAINTDSSFFDTRRLTVSADGDCITYKTTLGSKLFCGAFIAGGAVYLAVTGIAQGRWIPVNRDDWVLLLASLFFVAIGAAMHYVTAIPITFSKSQSLFVKGRGKRQRRVLFADIHALQLISSHVVPLEGNEYDNYQLNVVFRDGDRLHIVSYSSPDRAFEDAMIL